MVFLFGAQLPEQKFVRFALRQVFGIGAFKADRLCHQLQIHPRCRVNELSEPQISALAKSMEADPDKVGHELQRKLGQRIQHYHNIKSQRGDRYARGLPVNGQRSSTNAQTAKKRLGLFVKLQPYGTYY